MERSGFPETLYLFREWSEADFPKLYICFGNGAKRISRNSIFVLGMERSGFPETLYLFREWSEADFPKLLCYLGFGKSYLIPETINFDIGEGIKEMNEFKLPLFSLVPRIKK